MNIKELIGSLCTFPEENKDLLMQLLRVPFDQNNQITYDGRKPANNEVKRDLLRHIILGNSETFRVFVYNNLYSDCLDELEDSKGFHRIAEKLNSDGFTIKKLKQYVLEKDMLRKINKIKSIKASEEYDNLRNTTRVIRGKNFVVHGI